MNNNAVFGAKKVISFIAIILFAIFSSLLFTQTANAAPITINQCNGVDNVGGLNVECTVTVVNTLNQATGATSSAVTVEECHGVANAAPLCVTTGPTASTDLILQVTQCDGSGSGGGGTVDCSVNITNNIIGVGSVSPVTVNQCSDSGTGGGTEPTIECNPVSLTTGATVTQCNGSGNDGGGERRVICTVDTTGTETSAIPVKVSQCNGSGNGGGSYVTCSASVLSLVVAASTSSAPTDLTSTVVGKTITSTWTAPTNDGGSPVTGYEVTYTGDDGSVRNQTTSDTTATSEELTPGVTYTVSVVAVNSVGSSPAASTSVTVPADAGTPPNSGVVPPAPSTDIPQTTEVPEKKLAETGFEALPLAVGSGTLLLLGMILVAFHRRLVNSTK